MSEKLKVAQDVSPQLVLGIANAAIALVQLPGFKLIRGACPEGERLAREVEALFAPMPLTECALGGCLDPTRCGRKSKCLYGVFESVVQKEFLA